METAIHTRGAGIRPVHRWTALALGLGLLAAASARSARAQTKPVDAPPPAASADLVAEGRSLFRAACAPCHGHRGDGRGPAARGMDPAPRDFTGGAFRFRSTPSGAPPTDIDLFRTISHGVPGTWMPAWEDLLGERQRWAIVAYLKTLVPEMAPAEPPLELADEPPAAITAREGRWVYLALGCAKCHGTSGRGDGPSARTLTDDDGHRLRPPDLARSPRKGGSGPADLYRTLRTGLTGTPMPAYEPHAVLFAGGDRAAVANFAPDLRGNEQVGLAEYLRTEPDGDTIDALPDPARTELVERRLWSLVAYLESLTRPRGILHWLFTEDPNATPPRRSP